MQNRKADGTHTMLIRNADVKGTIVDILIENGVIVSCQPVEASVLSEDQAVASPVEELNAKGCKVIPGLIEIHAHGCLGHDTMDAEFTEMCAYLASQGTTSWLPTTMTMPLDDLRHVATADTNVPGTQILGFHFEGPCISVKKKGAQNEANIRQPKIEDYADIPHIKMMTIAPELSGSMEFIKEFDAICSIGHTDCDYDTAMAAIDAGANCLTHMYNAMPGMQHRAPGPICAGADQHIYAQLICDGLHIHPAMVRAAWHMYGSDRLILISDSIRPAGLPDGVYESGGLTVYMKNGEARLEDGTLAGSSSTLWHCVKKAIEFGIPFDEAVQMATQNPAELLGIKKGTIAAGYDADLLILDEENEIRQVIIAGEVYKA